MNTEKVLTEINALIVTETLGKKGIDVLKSLKDAVEELTEDNKESQESLQVSREEREKGLIEIDDLCTKNNNLTSELEEFKKREKALVEFEFEKKLLKQECACADLRRNDIFNLVSLVFKSPMIKKSIMSSESHQALDQNGYAQNLHNTKTTDITETTE